MHIKMYKRCSLSCLSGCCSVWTTRIDLELYICEDSFMFTYLAQKRFLSFFWSAVAASHRESHNKSVC